MLQQTTENHNPESKRYLCSVRIRTTWKPFSYLLHENINRPDTFDTLGQGIERVIGFIHGQFNYGLDEARLPRKAIDATAFRITDTLSHRHFTFYYDETCLMVRYPFGASMPADQLRPYREALTGYKTLVDLPGKDTVAA